MGIFIGLLLGAAVAAAAAWYFLHSAPVHMAQAGHPPESSIIPQGSAPIALPGKPGDKPVEKPEFDFYKILPQGDGTAAAPSGPVPSGNPPAAATTPAAATPDRLYLQVGAFSDPSEADNLKARLALMGIEASSQRVDVPDKGTVHRVRIGPFASPGDMSAIRTQLSQLGISSTVVKVKGQE